MVGGGSPVPVVVPVPALPPVDVPDGAGGVGVAGSGSLGCDVRRGGFGRRVGLVVVGWPVDGREAGTFVLFDGFAVGSLGFGARGLVSGGLAGVVEMATRDGGTAWSLAAVFGVTVVVACGSELFPAHE